ncbi:MAG: hypothetical protein KDA61_00730, partial [Planctomycetales bacterium]|nr:hypothetical protein [Planctomycetales bacterium]
SVRMEYVAGQPGFKELNVQLQVRSGRLEDPRLARPVVDIEGTAVADQRQLRVESLHGKWGDATVGVALTRNGWSARAPFALRAQVHRAPLDRALYQSLPEILRSEWDKFKPEGEVDGEAQVVFDGRRWKPSAVLRGRNLAFESDKFAYRLTQGSGELRFKPPTPNLPATLEIDLVGRGGGQPLHIVGQVFDPKPAAAGWVEIAGKDIEIERAMIDALPEKPREVIASLHPAGRFDVHWRLERTYAGQDKPKKTLRLEVHDLEVNYDRFPYPLRGIHGSIHADDEHWEFRELAAGGRRTVRCQGRLDPVDEGTELSLHFEGEQTPLDDDLFAALPPAVQRAWTELQARGHFDFNADVYHRSGLPKPNIRAVIRPRPETAQIKPQFFDYLMERLSGAIVYQDGEVTLDEVRAAHAKTTAVTNGRGYFAPDGSWQFQLTGLTVDKLTPHGELLAAMPKALRRMIDQLKPTGYFSVSDASLAFRRSRAPVAPVEASWNLLLYCHQTSLQAGVELKDIDGAVRLIGAHDGQRAYTSGELDLDGVTFQDVPFTKVQGPFYGEPSQFRLGHWATDAQRATPRRVTAVAYDGDVAFDAWVAFDALPTYHADVDCVGLDLNRLVVERFGGARYGGRVDAKLSLGGAGRQLDALQGGGEVHVREANIYELPMLLSMLKMLRSGTGDTSAFDRSEIKYRLVGRNIYLDQLDFLGDVVNLYGKGYANFDQELKLAFHGVVGHAPSQLPLVNSFMGRVNQQILEMYVDGTVGEPVVTKQALPQLKRFLEQIQTDLASPPPRSVQR